MRISVLIAFVGFLSGCTTITNENAGLATPIADPTKSEIVSGAWKADGLLSDKAIFRKLNDETFYTYNIGKTQQIEPGNSEVTLHYVGSKGKIINRVCQAEITFPFEFEPNRRYLAYGKRTGEKVSLWIEDAKTRRRVSDIFEAEIIWYQPPTIIYY